MRGAGVDMVCALGRLTGSLSLPPESPVVCPNCGSDHVVLLAVSGEISNREQTQGDKPPDPSGVPDPVCDLANHSSHPSGSDGTPPQTSIAHGRSSWSLSPSEYGKTRWGCVWGRGGHGGKVSWSCGLPEPG